MKTTRNNHNTLGILSAATALASGVLVTLSLAPFEFWPAAILSALLLFIALEKTGVRHAFYLGWLFGAGMFGSGASWVYVSIHEFGYTSVPLAALLTALFCGGLALCTALSWGLFSRLNAALPDRRYNRTILVSVLFAFVWVGGEWLRVWLLSGFPWLFIGYSQTESILASWAPVIGVYGIGLIIAFTGATLAQLITRFLFNQHNQQFSLPACATLITVSALLWLMALPLEKIDWTQTDTQPQQVSLVQANISQHEKWRADNLQPTLALYREMSEPHWANSDLIIWPEAAIPTFYQYANQFLDQIHHQAIAHNAALITGIPTRPTYSDSAFNSIVSAGNASGVYHKQRLVPFGEYVPFANTIGNIMAFFELPMSTMSAGEKQQAPISIHNWQSRPLICYEVVYPDLAAQAAQISDVLITISNDSWFGASIGPLQHLQMAQMRALENGRYVLRGTGNGVSAVIDPKGQIVSRSEQFKQQVISGTFYISRGQTPWTAMGYYLMPGLIATVLMVFIANALRSARLEGTK